MGTVARGLLVGVVIVGAFGCSTTTTLQLADGSTVSGIVREHTDPPERGDARELRAEHVLETDPPGKTAVRAGAPILAVGVAGLIAGFTLFAEPEAASTIVESVRS